MLQFEININDGRIELSVIKLLSLTFLASISIAAAFETIKNGLSGECFEILKPLLNYYLNTWISNVGVNNMSCFLANESRVEKFKTFAEYENDFK